MRCIMTVLAVAVKIGQRTRPEIDTVLLTTEQVCQNIGQVGDVALEIEIHITRHEGRYIVVRHQLRAHPVVALPVAP